MLSITAVSAGAVDYLLRGSGCAVHEHDFGSAEAVLAAEGPGGSRSEQSAGVEYLLGGDWVPVGDGPALGVWFGAGLDMVGMAPRAGARETDVRAVFGQLRHPGSTVEEPVFLGRPPRSFRSVQERIAAACAVEPDADPERRAEIANAVAADRRKAVAYYDLTFSPAKSVSVYWAALLAADLPEEADRVVRAHTEAIAEAMAWAEGEVAWTRVGYHGRTASGRSVGRYEPGSGLVWTRWDHWTNRACEPQLHAHVAVLNRTVTSADGVVRALDGRRFRAVKHGIDAIYAQGLERRLGELCGVVFAERPDGKAREILGIDPALLREASSRRAAVVDHVAGMVADYWRRHGHEPGPAARAKLARAAALATRDGKSHQPVAEQVQAWCAPRQDRLREALTQARTVANTHRDQRNHSGGVPDEVLVAAVEEVQGRHASWDVGLLMAAIGDQLARTNGVAAASESLPVLAERVLAAPGRFGIVQVSAPEPGLIPVPDSLLRPDRSSVLRPHRDQRYTTLDQLSTENGIVALARAHGAPALDAPAAAQVRDFCDSAGLGACQISAVIGILSSGRVGEVLIGPAGVGKSHTLAMLAQAWREQLGGRVLGLATSQIATLELADNGLDALNTTQFLLRATHRDQRIRPEDLVVVDEVGMTATAELAQITRLVARAGGKLVFSGDPEQLAAIDAGGMLGLLAADNGYHELVEVHRFEHDWEKTASLRLREGDPAVLDLYEQRGRIAGGDAIEVSERAVRGYLADTLTGQASLLVVSSNADAAELSARVRAELVRLRWVESQVLCTDRDGNDIGVGDLIQARRNAPVPIGDTGMVTNRAVYRVTGAGPSGGLRVSDAAGRAGVLPHDYVAEHVTLGYAATVWAAQGRTVDTCHAVIDPATTRRGVYVALTRGRAANTAYVVCEADADEHQHEPLATTARAQLTAILATVDDETTRTAELTRRAGIGEARFLAWIVGQWDLVATEQTREQVERVLRALLPGATVRAVASEPGYRRLCRAVRAAELAGHDPAALIAEVVAQRPLFGADSISDVLRWRIHTTTPARTPDRDTATGWAAMTPRIAGPVGQYLTELAESADTRQHELGLRALHDEPGWALHHLGPAPAAGPDRAEWARRAGIIAAYRDLTSVPDTATSLGGAPSLEQPLHRALWRRAVSADGAPADALDYTSATTHDLRQMRAAYQRELLWAPPHVADELRDARLAATGYQTDEILWRAEAELLAPATPERTRADADADAAAHLARLCGARAEHLQIITTAREHWHTDTQPARTRAELAGDELTRRGLPRDPTPTPAGEQLALPGEASYRHEITIDAPAAATYDTASPVLALFGLEPNPSDLAAAQPLRPVDRSHPDHSVTVGHARRLAEISDTRRAGQHWETLQHTVHQRLDPHPDSAALGEDPAEEAHRRRIQRHAHHTAAELAHEHDSDTGADLDL